MSATQAGPVIHPLAKCSWCGAAFEMGTVLNLDAWLCPTEACWRRQTDSDRTMYTKPRGASIQCRFVPLPRQVDAMDALEGPALFILIGGAAGGSKSRGLREIAHARAMNIPHYRVLLLRRTYSQLEENHLRDVELEAPTMDAQFVPSAKLLRYSNGSTLRFGHCETVADAANYLSSEYDLIMFDELVTFEETQFLLIASRARSTKPGLVPKVLAGTNPGGPQSAWVRRRFLDKDVDRDEFPDYDPAEWAFIPSKLEDNPYLDASYERKLAALPPALRKAYRDGDWDIFPGQYFPEWRKATHVTATHIAYPPHVARYLSMDWGFVKPGVVGWWVWHDGHLYREREYVFTRTPAFEVGQQIAIRSAGLTNVRYLVFDTAMEIPQNDSGESTIETVRRGMRAAGRSIATRQADKDRINGWQRLRHWLSLAPDKTPWMQSSPECKYFNRTIPSLVSDDTKPEDVDTDGDDHAGDETRYLVQSLPLPVTAERPRLVPVGSPAWIMAQLRSKQGRAFGRVA